MFIPSQALSFTCRLTDMNKQVVVTDCVRPANCAFFFLWLEFSVILFMAPAPNSHLLESFVDPEKVVWVCPCRKCLKRWRGSICFTYFHCCCDWMHREDGHRLRGPSITVGMTWHWKQFSAVLECVDACSWLGRSGNLVLRWLLTFSLLI